MPNSTSRAGSRKAANSKPRKPYADYPLFPHNSGRWAKKIRGKLHYFGQWARRDNGKLVRVPGDGWQEALDDYRAKADDLHAGREPREVGDGCTLRELANAFLRSKQAKLDSGELAPNTFADYHRVCARLIDHFGRSRRVDDLRPDDFEKFRRKLSKAMSIVALKNEINRCRIIFKFASDQRLISEPVHYGQSFDKPSAKMIRKARNEAGPRLFCAGELRTILTALEGKPVVVEGMEESLTLRADPSLRAMVLLGINGGLGNTDVANLPIAAINFTGGWLDYPRPKTEIQRRIPLWPETLAALREAIHHRPPPKDAADAGLCFLTIQGNRWVRQTPHRKNPNTFTTVNTVGARFGKLLKKLGINGRKRLGFYTLRHNFETIGGGAKDQVAVDAIMGHVDSSMAAAYRESIDDKRLRDVVDHVHRWLFGDAGAGVDQAGE